MSLGGDGVGRRLRRDSEQPSCLRRSVHGPRACRDKGRFTAASADVDLEFPQVGSVEGERLLSKEDGPPSLGTALMWDCLGHVHASMAALTPRSRGRSFSLNPDPVT
jgi:hypothetical protein